MTDLARDGEHLYWVDPGKSAIGRAKLGVGGPEPPIEGEFITGADNPKKVALHDGYIYWTNAGDETEGTGSVGRARRTLTGGR